MILPSICGRISTESKIGSGAWPEVMGVVVMVTVAAAPKALADSRGSRSGIKAAADCPPSPTVLGSRTQYYFMIDLDGNTYAQQATGLASPAPPRRFVCRSLEDRRGASTSIFGQCLGARRDCWPIYMRPLPSRCPAGPGCAFRRRRRWRTSLGLQGNRGLRRRHGG
jgi:hypothetical protein